MRFLLKFLLLRLLSLVDWLVTLFYFFNFFNDGLCTNYGDLSLIFHLRSLINVSRIKFEIVHVLKLIHYYLIVLVVLTRERLEISNGALVSMTTKRSKIPAVSSSIRACYNYRIWSCLLLRANFFFQRLDGALLAIYMRN
jgi:hypothetical protein